MSDLIPCHIKSNNSQNEVIRLRRHFHKTPELGFTEYWTSSEICGYLSELGFDIHYGKALYQQAYPNVGHISEITQVDAHKIDAAFEIAKQTISDDKWLTEMKGGFTGVIATLTCSSDGPATGFRFDIDGLPIRESNAASHQPNRAAFTSQNQNMHACGHDGHLSIGLALAKRIAENRKTLSGKFVFIFQPAEEGPSGAKVFSRFDIFKNLDYLVPLHVGIIDTRKIVCGLSFMGLKNLRIAFHGKNAHAAVSPEKGKNALQAACAAINNLYGLSHHSDGATRVNVGLLSSTNPTNIIADYTEFELELRGQTTAICDYLHEQALNIIQGAAQMYGVTVDIDLYDEYVSVENSDAGVALLKQAALNAGINQEAIIDRYFTAGSEDASFLMNEVIASGGIASYLCLGSQTSLGHHHPEFDFDEDMLLYGIDILWEFIRCVQPS
jgi:aminobenzoyl-glutamate utilization protein A